MAKSPTTVTVETIDGAAMIDDRSRNVLVHLTGTDIDHRLLREAGTYVAGTGGKLVLVSIMPMDEFTNRQQAYAPIDHLPTYSVSQAKESGKYRALQIAHQALRPLGIDYTAVGMVGRENDRLLTAAQQYNCGHLFLVDQPQSLFHRLVVRSLGQTITRKFDGLVTVLQANYDEEISSKRRWTIRG